MTIVISNVDSADRFLNLAFDDLNSAKLLYEQLLFPQAVFHLQQAVEKGIKSLGIYFGIITETQAKKEVGHKGLILFEKTTNHLGARLTKINETIQEHPELKQVTEITNFDFNELEKQSQSLATQLHRLSKQTDGKKTITSEELHVAFKQLDELISGLAVISEALKKNPFTDEAIKQKKEEYLLELQPILRYFPDKKDEIEKNLDSLMDHLKNKEFLTGVILPIAEIGCASMLLFHLTIITQPHAMTARYPDGDFDPAEFYTAQNPLIREFPRLMDYIYHALSILDRTYGSLPVDGGLS